LNATASAINYATYLPATDWLRGQPVISVDTKKKELVGPFKNGGREWQPVGVAVDSNGVIYTASMATSTSTPNTAS
jgi:hypothetical protein